jgi:DNA-binding GntR family transcriptional regulator
MRGELKAGQPLRQSDVASFLDVSTTPVREALRQLAAEGLVDGDPHRGATVHQMTKAELTEVYAIMIPLEQIAMQAASGKVSNELRRSAEVVLDQMDASDSVADFAMLNVEFHSLLCGASGMQILADTLRRLRNLSALYVASAVVDSNTLREEAGREHRELLAALLAGDSSSAVEIATRHISRTRDERLRSMLT